MPPLTFSEVLKVVLRDGLGVSSLCPGATQ
jgi:hypothetical protein